MGDGALLCWPSQTSLSKQIQKLLYFLVIVFLTCDKELLGEGAAVEGCNLLLQTHSQNAGGQRHRDRRPR